MPELPEVEAVARTLRPLIAGRTIRRCRVIHPIAARLPSGRDEKQGRQQLETALPGARIQNVSRLGKYLLLDLDRGLLVMHFRLDGQLVWFDSAHVSGHIDVALELDHGTLAFVDPRHFGRVHWVQVAGLHPGLRSLGVDPLSKEFSSRQLCAMLSRSRRPVKLLLMDQERIAGLGNIYANESLWRARLDPRRPARRVKRAEAFKLHNAIVDVLNRALKCCLSPAPDFRDAGWWFQGLERLFRVYGREGKPCCRCGKPVQRIAQGGRSSFVCFRCQR